MSQWRNSHNGVSIASSMPSLPSITTSSTTLPATTIVGWEKWMLNRFYGDRESSNVWPISARLSLEPCTRDAGQPPNSPGSVSNRVCGIRSPLLPTRPYILVKYIAPTETGFCSTEASHTGISALHRCVFGRLLLGGNFGSFLGSSRLSHFHCAGSQQIFWPHPRSLGLLQSYILLCACWEPFIWVGSLCGDAGSFDT